jgi:hypothetical protein
MGAPPATTRSGRVAVDKDSAYAAIPTQEAGVPAHARLVCVGRAKWPMTMC